MSTSLSITIRHRDVGATLATDIYIGEHLVVSYMAGTRHIETAQDTAEQTLASALGKVIGAELGKSHAVSYQRLMRDDSDND